jgi:hypothetical protein
MGGAVWIVILLGLSAHKDGDNRIVFVIVLGQKR